MTKWVTATEVSMQLKEEQKAVNGWWLVNLDHRCVHKKTSRTESATGCEFLLSVQSVRVDQRTRLGRKNNCWRIQYQHIDLRSCKMLTNGIVWNWRLLFLSAFSKFIPNNYGNQQQPYREERLNDSKIKARSSQYAVVECLRKLQSTTASGLPYNQH